MAEEKYEVSKEEYGELLSFKKEKILRKAQEDAKKIDEELAKLFNTRGTGLSENQNHSNGDEINSLSGWKTILEYIFKKHGPELTTAELIGYANNLPIGDEKKRAASKSISSNLSSRLKGDDIRYKLIERNGKRYYALI